MPKNIHFLWVNNMILKILMYILIDEKVFKGSSVFQCFQSLNIYPELSSKSMSKSKSSENPASPNSLWLTDLGQEPAPNQVPDDPPLEESRKLQDLIKSFKTSTAQEDFIHNLR